MGEAGLVYERGGKQRDVYDAGDVEAVPCPLCEADDAERLYTERAVLCIVRCRACQLIYVSPRLKNPEQVYWGDAEKYMNEARQIFAGRLPHHRDPNYIDDLALLARFKPTGDFLDVGTNMGFFLRHTRGRAWRAVGVEPSPSLSEMARKYFGLDVRTGFLETAGFPERAFDVITMTDVFEHIVAPRVMLREVRRLLRADGVVLIKVPNGLYNLAKQRALEQLGKTKAFDIWDAYEHVVHYSSRTLRRMLESEGFSILHEGIARPIQLPAWHRYVGAYFQYPIPWRLDWKRQTVRSLLYYASRVEALLRGAPGALAPNIIVVARAR
jgi:SAM-dependent methyltransferase